MSSHNFIAVSGSGYTSSDMPPSFRPHTSNLPTQLGIDVTLLTKLADALGTLKLTLFLPDFDKTLSDKTPASTPVNGGFVKKPVAVCPANGEDNLDALPRRTQSLHGLLDDACGLAA